MLAPVFTRNIPKIALLPPPVVCGAEAGEQETRLAQFYTLMALINLLENGPISEERGCLGMLYLWLAWLVKLNWTETFLSSLSSLAIIQFPWPGLAAGEM